MLLNKFVFYQSQEHPNTLEKRLKIEDYFRIGHGSAKTCLKRLNMLGITLDELKEVLKTI